MPAAMNVSDFAYDLPPGLIAQTPAASRDASRLLVLDRRTGTVVHAKVRDLPRLLQPGDLLVVNNTKVFPARLLGRRIPTGGMVECLLVGRLDADRWDALMHPGQKLRPGGRIVFSGGGRQLHGEVLERRFYGRRVIRLWTDDGSAVDEAIDEIGHVPLPPYIRRPDEPADRERYQTVFARIRGSVAAPTAGLHLTDVLLHRLAEGGVECAEITLHVGYGTFKPVRGETVEQHTVDAERFDIGPDAASVISRALAEQRRVIAVGTTTTRALESAAKAGLSRVEAMSGWTDLFIYPGFSFRVISGLVTNFHLPRSSLLMLVSAFAGRDQTLSAYREAVRLGYRFYSYGDAMLIL
jgi:S-adenosylmethionine:tRNA ribosyltransferase-isomerase